jgi:hypothetical protein
MNIKSKPLPPIPQKLLPSNSAVVVDLVHNPEEINPELKTPVGPGMLCISFLGSFSQ